MASDQLRYTGLAAVAVLWAALGAGAAISGFDLLAHRPLSHLAAAPAAALLFGGGLAAAAVLFLAFHRYLRGRFPTSMGFSVAMVGGMAAQLVAAFVPVDGGPLEHGVHTVAALALAGSLPVFMWRFAAAQPPGPLRRATARLSMLEVAACVLGVWLSRGGVAPLAEIVPAAVFHAWVARLTFWPDEPPLTVAPPAGTCRLQAAGARPASDRAGL